MRLSSAPNGVLFDFWGDQSLKRYAWPERPDDAWLVLDRNNDGEINSGAEFFGNAARLASGQRAKHGYEILDELDTNRDGVINASDPIWSRLQLWRDVRRNGHVDGNELVSLRAANIVALETRYEESQRTDQWGNAFRLRSVVLRTQGRRFAWDVFLTTDEE